MSYPFSSQIWDIYTADLNKYTYNCNPNTEYLSVGTVYQQNEPTKWTYLYLYFFKRDIISYFQCRYYLLEIKKSWCKNGREDLDKLRLWCLTNGEKKLEVLHITPITYWNPYWFEGIWHYIYVVYQASLSVRGLWSCALGCSPGAASGELYHIIRIIIIIILKFWIVK